MNAADWHALTITGCIIAVVVVVALITGFARGWFEFTAHFKVIPPLRRKAAEPRAKASAADDVPAPVPLDVRKAS